MLDDHLPIYRLRLRTEKVELRLPGHDEIAALADVAADGVHEPDAMPFDVPWSDTTPKGRGRSVALWAHRAIGLWEAENWHLPFVVFYDGGPVGVQSVRGRSFAGLREVSTGSWLGLEFQGKGIGTHMRAAVLHFGFACLDAEWARSGSFDGSDASAGVSRKLGYREDGFQFREVQGRRRRERRWRLSREDWQAHRRHECLVEGLDEEVLEMLGLSGSAV